MAYTNTIYYLNSQDEFDNEILMSPCSMIMEEERQMNSDKILANMFIALFAEKIYNGVPEVLCDDLFSLNISSKVSSNMFLDMPPNTFSNVSSDICVNPFSEVSTNTLTDISYKNHNSDYVRSFSMESNLEASALREKLIYGVWWKEFGVIEDDIIESVSINENGKVLCRGVITLSKNQRNIYLIGDICFKPYLKERLIAIIDFASNYIFCQKMFIRVKKSCSGFKTLIGNLLWIGFQIIPSALFSSQSYLLLSISL
ncbi:hypothetical protein PMAC_003059 [Pneumocystis sp. 'macacae']|nr:hypothetical protein PMAC_003059 [Pneumocystis sp. 'macacae']